MSKDNDTRQTTGDTTEEAISPSPRTPADPLIGTKIGSCTLKRILGSGGMGTVYEALQESPRRRVALKMMKKDITSRSATRRFESESQTLARLKHQGVAQIYEAGTHDDGSGGVPYFVMEYIPNAKTITEYADEKNLGTKKRMSLFTKVCDAIQHGHLKGIVHRDLKPGNILVDSSGQPKVIDFGVARSTDSDMVLTTLQTDVGQLIGTVQYMSPEQCEADPSDIDTRSDVYALGVILYELLTGKPPYSLQRMAIHEAVRIVREEEPAKLSTIGRHLRGDIETIAMKALEKDRERRYQSATELKQDIQHYLEDEPISAKPPGFIDYLRRFAKKHTAAAVAISTIFVVLVAAVVGISNFAINAAKERTRAEQVLEFLTSMISSGDSANPGAIVEDRFELMLSEASKDLEEHFADQPLVEAKIRDVIGRFYKRLYKFDEAKPEFVEVLAIRRRILGDNHPDTLSSLHNMGILLYREAKYDDAEVHFLQALEGRRDRLGDKHRDTLASITAMGHVLKAQKKLNEAGEYYREAIETSKDVRGNDDKDTLRAMNNMGAFLKAQGKDDESELYYLQALKGYRRVLGDVHSDTLTSIRNMGILLYSQGKYDEAKPYLIESLKTRRHVLGDEHPQTLESFDNLINLYDAWGKPEEAQKYRDMLPEEDAVTEDTNE